MDQCNEIKYQSKYYIQNSFETFHIINKLNIPLEQLYKCQHVDIYLRYCDVMTVMEAHNRYKLRCRTNLAYQHYKNNS